jgi:hypothetical protein
MENEEFFSCDGLFSSGPSYSDYTSDGLLSLDDLIFEGAPAQNPLEKPRD